MKVMKYLGVGIISAGLGCLAMDRLWLAWLNDPKTREWLLKVWDIQLEQHTDPQWSWTLNERQANQYKPSKGPLHIAEFYGPTGDDPGWKT